MKSDKDIETLVYKYYTGETSLEEEKQLRDFFSGETVPEHLKTYQGQFKDMATAEQVSWEGFTDEKLFGKLEKKLDESARPEKEAKTVKIYGATEVWFYRIAAAVALILVGYFVGKDTSTSEADELKQMMLAEMSARSASGRLKAVSYSFSMQEADDEIIDALVKTVLEERNMNVRLKGVEALARFGDKPIVREVLISALESEKEPAVKIALIEALVNLRDVSAIEGLQKVSENEDNLKEVREEAHLGIFKLREM